MDKQHYSSWSVQLRPSRHRQKLSDKHNYLIDPTGVEIDLDPPAGDAFGYLIDRKWYRKLRSIFLVSTFSRIHGPLFKNHFGVYGVYQERARHLASSPWIIHPYSTFRWIWDIMMTLVLICCLVVQPVMISFYVESLDSSKFLILGGAVGLMFILDIVLNFRTGFVSEERDTINLEPSDIFWMYLKTWFIVDLLASIPYDALHYVLCIKFQIIPQFIHAKDYLQSVRLFELLKVCRLVRMIRNLTKFQEAYMMEPLYIRVTNLFTVKFFTIHWITCLHYLIADFVRPPPPAEPDPRSWVTVLKLWNAPTKDKYLSALLRAISNMAGLGYGGGEPPRTNEDILCTSFSILIGATFFAFFIGNLSSILVSMDVAEKKYAEIINQVNEYMRFKQVPKHLQHRVILYYEHRYRRNYFNEDNILLSLSDVLRQQLQMFNCRRLLEKVPLFRGMSLSIVQNIVSRLEFEVFLPHDVIIASNTAGDAMYFIEHGQVKVLAPNGCHVATLKDGDCFGEMALLKNHKRDATVIAVTYCDMYLLTREHFEDAIKGYPEVYEKLFKMAEERATETARIIEENSAANRHKEWKNPFKQRRDSIFDDSPEAVREKSSTYTTMNS